LDRNPPANADEWSQEEELRATHLSPDERACIQVTLYFVPVSWARLCATLALRAALRPRLAADLVRVAWRFRRRAWYRQLPFLPLPSPTYLRWRMYTAYGDEHAVPPRADVERYAQWATAAKTRP
jgi:hypothetical protein